MELNVCVCVIGIQIKKAHIFTISVMKRSKKGNQIKKVERERETKQKTKQRRGECSSRNSSARRAHK